MEQSIIHLNGELLYSVEEKTALEVMEEIKRRAIAGKIEEARHLYDILMRHSRLSQEYLALPPGSGKKEMRELLEIGKKDEKAILREKESEPRSVDPNPARKRAYLRKKLTEPTDTSALDAKEAKEDEEHVNIYGERLYRMLATRLCDKRADEKRSNGGGTFRQAMERAQTELDAFPQIREAFLKIKKNTGVRKVRKAFKEIIVLLNRLDQTVDPEERQKIIPRPERIEEAILNVLDSGQLMRRKFWKKKRKSGPGKAITEAKRRKQLDAPDEVLREMELGKDD